MSEERREVLCWLGEEGKREEENVEKECCCSYGAKEKGEEQKREDRREGCVAIA